MLCNLFLVDRTDEVAVDLEATLEARVVDADELAQIRRPVDSGRDPACIGPTEAEDGDRRETVLVLLEDSVDKMLGCMRQAEGGSASRELKRTVVPIVTLAIFEPSIFAFAKRAEITFSMPSLGSDVVGVLCLRDISTSFRVKAGKRTRPGSRGSNLVMQLGL